MFEITQKCNMACEHCLRGDARNVDMSFDIIDAILERVESIGQIGFTGGEPSLKPEIMRYILDGCKKRNIPVNSFYLATNAKEIKPEFLHILIDWYAYCLSCDPYEAKEMSILAPSADEFHEYVPEENWNVLKAFSFWDDCKDYMDGKSSANRILIDEGRAKKLSADDYRKCPLVASKNVPATLWGDSLSIEELLYFSADGKVKTCCDTAYDNDDYTIGNVFFN